MAEQTPEQSVYGIPNFAFNSNGWGPCSIPEQFQDLPLETFSRDDKLGMIIDINMLLGMQKLQSRNLLLLWYAYTQILTRMMVISLKWIKYKPLCLTRAKVFFVHSF